jgi:ATP synthase protein I
MVFKGGGSVKKETLQTVRDLAFYSSLGFSVALSIFIGLALGLYVDRKFSTSPWGMMGGLVMGIAAAFRNIGLAAKKSKSL